MYIFSPKDKIRYQIKVWVGGTDLWDAHQNGIMDK